ncbi:MAG: hypothetical protein LBQ74_00455 [Prevotella sp.]|jgi:uncharacterized repeat protein (TIGR01451 family)|nr:hypothetical protein [Prevotella sp.]
MFVEFEYPVEEIYVVHTYRGSSGYKRIGIGAMEFICPQPLPEPTEDGLIFTKQGPSDILTCEQADYTFRITNTNCAPYPVNFSDILPAGMKWVSNSLSVDDEAVENASINAYGGGQVLAIDNLSVPGASTLTFRASAVFDMSAQAGAYSNRAGITYESGIYPGQNITLESCDRLTSGCQPTITNATVAPNRPYPVELTIYNADISCYKEGKTATVTIKINNPNSFSISDSDLDIAYNDEFSYVTGSLSSTISSLGTVTTDETGVIFAEEFTIPSGISTITFKVKAPDKSDLVYQEDENGDPILDDNGDPIVENLIIEFNIASSTADVCLQGALYNLSGLLDIPYCISKDCIISNKNVTSKIKR